MTIKVQWPGQADKTEYSMPEEKIRAGLDFAIRNNPDFWDVVRDVAGKYQAELLRAELKKQKARSRRMS